jgi:hypothetical protein
MFCTKGDFEPGVGTRKPSGRLLYPDMFLYAVLDPRALSQKWGKPNLIVATLHVAIRQQRSWGEITVIERRIPLLGSPCRPHFLRLGQGVILGLLHPGCVNPCWLKFGRLNANRTNARLADHQHIPLSA